MFKLLAVFLSLPLFAAFPAAAQTAAASAAPAETALDREADNLNIVSAEERLKLKRSNTKSLDLNLKNSTKGEISDIIKNANLAEKRAARQEGRTPETAVNVDPADKRAVRKMLQKDLYLDPHPVFMNNHFQELQMNNQPHVILVQPQLAENVGMAARAMMNCGLYNLSLVSRVRTTCRPRRSPPPQEPKKFCKTPACSTPRAKPSPVCRPFTQPRHDRATRLKPFTPPNTPPAKSTGR